MPLYEYKCSECGAQFEIIQKAGDELLKKCIRCGGKVRKIISPPALQFKGSGWYITDYTQKAESKASSKTEDKKIPKEKNSAETKKSASQEKK